MLSLKSELWGYEPRLLAFVLPPGWKAYLSLEPPQEKAEQRERRYRVPESAVPEQRHEMNFLCYLGKLLLGFLSLVTERNLNDPFSLDLDIWTFRRRILKTRQCFSVEALMAFGETILYCVNWTFIFAPAHKLPEVPLSYDNQKSTTHFTRHTHAHARTHTQIHTHTS